jgi:hypothetical protein
MRAPETGLSIVSPALAMMLLPFPQIDILPPKVVQCMLRNPLRNPYSPECVEGVFSEVWSGDIPPAASVNGRAVRICLPIYLSGDAPHPASRILK